MNKGLKDGYPENISHDGIDIISRDIPVLMNAFDQWYYRQAPADAELAQRLNQYISQGKTNTAFREAWPIFKTRMVAKFGLDRKLDGHALVEAIFGSTGAAEAFFVDNSEREGYRNLFKGLYSLYRNPVIHNSDVEYSTVEAEAALALINSTLIRIDPAA